MSFIFHISLLVLSYIVFLIPLLLSVALLTLCERKLLSSIQRRKGPNIVGFWGLLQPFSDALKLLVKETIVPLLANKSLFFLAPVLSFSLSLLVWLVIPFSYGSVLSDLNIGLLYIFAISSLSVYGIILAGWASNSRYAFLGALRSSAQMISYEVSIGLILMSIILPIGSLNLTDLVLFQAESIWFVIPFFPNFSLFSSSMSAETNRPPFDLPEAEAELVSGYNVEYSSAGFALSFTAEYANITFTSALAVISFFGGWSPFIANIYDTNIFFNSYILYIYSCIIFVIKIFIFLTFSVFVRAAYPRYRYDQLMNLGWKFFLPLSFSLFIYNALFFFSFPFPFSLLIFIIFIVLVYINFTSRKFSKNLI